MKHDDTTPLYNVYYIFIYNNEASALFIVLNI